jgi:SHS2 domain-containing protein
MDEFKFLDHPADIAVELKAESIEKLFEIAAEAWKSSVLETISTESPFELHINIESLTMEELLVEFLSELNFILFSRKLVFSKIKNLLIIPDSTLRLQSVIYFEDFNPLKHQIKAEIKAITFHQMSIEKTDAGFFTRMIFDI